MLASERQIYQATAELLDDTHELLNHPAMERALGAAAHQGMMATFDKLAIPAIRYHPRVLVVSTLSKKQHGETAVPIVVSPRKLPVVADRGVHVPTTDQLDTVADFMAERTGFTKADFLADDRWVSRQFESAQGHPSRQDKGAAAIVYQKCYQTQLKADEGVERPVTLYGRPLVVMGGERDGGRYNRLYAAALLGHELRHVLDYFEEPVHEGNAEDRNFLQSEVPAYHQQYKIERALTSARGRLSRDVRGMLRDSIATKVERSRERFASSDAPLRVNRSMALEMSRFVEFRHNSGN